MERLAHGWVEHSTVEREGSGSAVKSGAAIELERGPGEQSLLPEKFPKPTGVAGNLKHRLGGPSSRLMLAMSVTRRSAEDRHDDLGPKPADDSEDRKSTRLNSSHS